MKVSIKELAKPLAAVFLGLALALVLAEILCRLSPIGIAYFRISEKPDDRVGFTRFPGTVASSKTLCYDISPIEFNSLGFRDEEFPDKGGFSIAILGDSFMEAIEVPSDARTSLILERLLQQTVVNISMASYGTVTELFAYRTFLKPYKPHVVILFFTPDNDVEESSCVLTKLYGDTIAQPCGYIADGNVEWRTSFEQAGAVRSRSRIKQFLRTHCLSCLVAYRFVKYDLVNRFRHGDLDFLQNAFRHAPPEAWRKDWEQGRDITKKAILDLNKEVESTGGKLLIVYIPTSLALIPDWQKFLKEATGVEKIPEDFDPHLLEQWIEQIGKKHSIRTLNLTPHFLEYRDRFKMVDPYFWFSCDAHWNPVGHFLAANLVAQAMLDTGLLSVSGEKKEELALAIKKNLDLSPLDILGNRAYDQIYQRGLYRGSSNITTILERRVQ